MAKRKVKHIQHDYPFRDLQPGQIVVNVRVGAHYRIVANRDGKVYAQWRGGDRGRFGKGVVRLTPAHVVGFRLTR